MNLFIVLALAILAIPANTAMDELAKDEAPTLTSYQNMVDLKNVPQWSHQFSLIEDRGYILRDSKGIFVSIEDVQTGPDDHFKWLTGKTACKITPSCDLNLYMYMTQETFSAALKDAGILKTHSPFF